FLSSSAALHATVTERIKRIGPATTDDEHRELDALDRLDQLAVDGMEADSRHGQAHGKIAALVDYLQSIGIGRASDTRVVLFAERIPTLNWLKDNLPAVLDMKDEQFALLHGQLSDTE